MKTISISTLNTMKENEWQTIKVSYFDKGVKKKEELIQKYEEKKK